MLDTLTAGLIVQAIGQLRILKDSLSKLEIYADEEVKIKWSSLKGKKANKKKRQIMYRDISKCIDHHNAIIK